MKNRIDLEKDIYMITEHYDNGGPFVVYRRIYEGLDYMGVLQKPYGGMIIPCHEGNHEYAIIHPVDGITEQTIFAKYDRRFNNHLKFGFMSFDSISKKVLIPCKYFKINYDMDIKEEEKDSLIKTWEEKYASPAITVMQCNTYRENVKFIEAYYEDLDKNIMVDIYDNQGNLLRQHSITSIDSIEQENALCSVIKIKNIAEENKEKKDDFYERIYNKYLREASFTMFGIGPSIHPIYAGIDNFQTDSKKHVIIDNFPNKLICPCEYGLSEEELTINENYPHIVIGSKRTLGNIESGEYVPTENSLCEIMDNDVFYFNRCGKILEHLGHWKRASKFNKSGYAIVQDLKTDDMLILDLNGNIHKCNQEIIKELYEEDEKLNDAIEMTDLEEDIGWIEDCKPFLHTREFKIKNEKVIMQPNLEKIETQKHFGKNIVKMLVKNNPL